MTDFDLNRAIAVLERTPSVLGALLAGLDRPWTHANEGGETWSPYAVLGHLIHGEKTDWLPRVLIIVGPGPDRRFAPFDRTAQLRGRADRSIGELLDEFRACRTDSLARLRALDLQPEDLDRTGIHPEFGVVTLRQLIATWVVHDLDHVTQVARVLAKQLSGDVGPWRAYLSVLGDRVPVV